MTPADYRRYLRLAARHNRGETLSASDLTELTRLHDLAEQAQEESIRISYELNPSTP
jgi:hypothetical protein